MPVRRFWLYGVVLFASVLIPLLPVSNPIPALGHLVDAGNKNTKVAQSRGEIPLYNIYMSNDGETIPPKKEEISEKIKAIQVSEPARQVEKVVQNSRGINGDSIPQEELDLLARVIYAEARGEGLEGQVAVGAVVLNRLKDPEFPKTIKDVIYQKGAFTAVADKQIHLQPNEVAFQAAQEALEGIDPTGGALYYYNPQTAKDQWIKTRPIVKRIGNHTFSI